mgnify:CR=1 FL=1
MKGLFNNSKILFIHVNDEKGIMDAVEFSKKQGVTKIVIVGGYETYKLAPYLKENKVSVLLQRVHSRPSNDDHDYDLPFKMAKILVDEGVTVALETSGNMERMNSRNLPFYAGTTVAHGLSKEQALQLITLNTAKILGIDAKYGSLEVGKSATLFISKGDALDMRTNQGVVNPSIPRSTINPCIRPSSFLAHTTAHMILPMSFRSSLVMIK